MINNKRKSVGSESNPSRFDETGLPTATLCCLVSNDDMQGMLCHQQILLFLVVIVPLYCCIMTFSPQPQQFYVFLNLSAFVQSFLFFCLSQFILSFLQTEYFAAVPFHLPHSEMVWGQLAHVFPSPATACGLEIPLLFQIASLLAWKKHIYAPPTPQHTHTQPQYACWKCTCTQTSLYIYHLE